MNPLNSLTMPISLEVFLVIALLAALIWQSIRLRNLRRGVSGLCESLDKPSLPTLREIPETAKRYQLEKLARITLDTVAEAELQAELSIGTRKIQSVLLDQVKEALIIVDLTQSIRFANTAAKRFFETEDYMGRPLIEVVLDHRFAETVDLALQTNGSIQDEIKMANDSRVFLIEAGKIDETYQIGEGAWLMINDISEKLHTDQVRKDFVANASHELRTPLSIIKGYLSMMSNDPKHENAVRIMLKHTERLTRVVDDMLLISRIESADGSTLESKTIFDISDCVYDMIEQLQPIIEAQKAKVTVKLPVEPDQREIYGDRFYWDQIIFNLVENALKQNPTAKLKISVIVIKEEGRFNIRVIDNGVGIPSTDLPEIFKRFYRVDKSHSQKIKGTGLGLSIVKRAVEAHHGQISVTSQPGQKTCFHISVPGPPVSVPEKTV